MFFKKAIDSLAKSELKLITASTCAFSASICLSTLLAKNDKYEEMLAMEHVSDVMMGQRAMFLPRSRENRNNRESEESKTHRYRPGW